MKKGLSLVFVLLLLVPLVSGCSGNKGNQANSSASKQYVIKFGDVEATDTNGIRGCNKFKELVEKQSNGRIKVEVYPNSQLGDETAMLEGVKSGTVQMTVGSAGGVARYYEPFNIFMVPYYLKGNSEQEQYQNLLKIAHSPVYDKLNSGLIKSTGMRALVVDWWLGNRYLTTTNKPVKTPQDLKGLMIRTPDSPAYVQTLKALGASVTPMAFSEVYMGLKQGVISGEENPPSNIYSMKFYEVQKYLSLTGHLTQNEVIVMNEKFYQSLPDDLKKIVNDSIEEASKYQSDLQVKDAEATIGKLQKLGMTVIDVDKESFINATKNVSGKILSADGLALLEEAKKAEQ